MLKRNKYHSKKCVVDGEKFDSKKEAGRYKVLRLLEEEGVIEDLRRQVKFVLIPTQREMPEESARSAGGVRNPKQGRVLEQECSYTADFVYKENGKTVVEDVKGVRTREYIIKRKLMLFMHDIAIKEV